MIPMLAGVVLGFAGYQRFRNWWIHEMDEQIDAPVGGR